MPLAVPILVGLSITVEASSGTSIFISQQHNLFVFVHDGYRQGEEEEEEGEEEVQK